MNGIPQADDLSPDLKERIRGYQEALSHGQAPSFEIYLSGLEGAERELVLRALSQASQSADPLPLAATVTWQAPAADPSQARPPAETSQDRTTAWVSPDADTDPERERDAPQRAAAAGHPTQARALAAPPTSIGRYRILRRLGSGAFGDVYLGEDPELRRPVAIKVPQPERIKSADDVQDFLNEARVLATLDHPGIVPVYDVGRQQDGVCYVVAKFIEGSDLAVLLKSRQLTIVEATRLVGRLAGALDHAHQRKLVHRDIKPGNILLDAEGNAYLADFGLAIRVEEYGFGPEFVGTPGYMSPEQARGESHRVDGRSDLYSLGVVFYRLLTGRRPYTAQDVTGILQQIVAAEVLPLRTENARVPAELERICLKMLARRAADRYQAAGEIAADLRAWEEQAQAVAPAIEPAPLVPKGLRAFDARDAGFFLDLLPGPRDRDGLPEALHFWKQRIEATDAEAFPVGLLLGPSGSGKSSLVRAGLLPRLSGRVLAIFVEAVAGQTESQLRAALRSACPRLPAAASFRETLAAIRRGRDLPVGQKVLLVIDQFEQWLAAHGAQADGELVEALRHCDGKHAQALLIARDDFALAATQFLDRLEVPLAQGKNFAVVDRFSRDHARKVLAAFGSALGRLPANPAMCSREQQRFLDNALDELSEEGKVAPVRLALFAEVLKQQTWEPAALRALGGAEGLGVAFLEEALLSPRAHPRLRHGAEAASRVLAMLLPSSGTNLKGVSRSREELLAAARMIDQPQRFDELLHLLDAEVRLITPTETLAGSSSGRRYQLAHDYLVPALRTWLMRKQRETLRGRTALRLAERAAEWTARPENRSLPALWEMPALLLLTRRRSWTPPERRMMHAAQRYYGVRGAVAAAVLAVAVLLGLYGWTHVREDQEAAQASERVRQLLTADPANVPAALAGLEPYRRWTDEPLRAMSGDTELPPHERRRARLGLLPVEPAQSTPLSADLVDEAVSLAEALALRDALAPHAAALAPGFWSILSDPRENQPKRFRAAVALAALDPEGQFAGPGAWPQAASLVAAQLLDHLAKSPASYQSLVNALRPIRNELIEPLAYVANRQDDRNSPLAVNLLLDYASDHPATLVNLAVGGDAARFAVLFPLLERRREAVVPLLEAEFAKRPTTPAWSDPPLPASWGRAAAAAVQRVEAAQGMVAERFAFCQTVPLSDLPGLLEALRPAGYRPTRVRPYLDGDGVKAAVLWTRDGLAWRLTLDLGPKDVRPADEQARADGFDAVDAAGYLTPASGAMPPAERYACLWVAAAPESRGSVIELCQTDAEFKELADALRPRVEQQVTHRILDLPTGTRRHVAVIAMLPNLGIELVETKRFDGTAGDYGVEHFLGRLQTEVDIGRSDQPRPLRERMTVLLKECDEKLARTEPDKLRDPNARNQRAGALFYLGRLEEAKKELDDLCKELPPYAWQFRVRRSMVLARLGQKEAAQQDVEAVRANSKEPARVDFLQAYVTALGGDLDGAERLIEKGPWKNSKDANVLYMTANSFGVLAEIAKERWPDRAPALAERTLVLLQAAVDAGYPVTARVRDDTDFEVVHEHPRFLSLLHKARLSDRYSGLWQVSLKLEAAEVHGLTPADQRQRALELASQGYRPAAVAVFRPESDAPLVAASVWHRPRVTEPEKQAVADRQAKAAIALLRLGRPETAWKELRFQPDPRLATSIIHTAAAWGVGPAAVAERLEREPAADVRRSLLLLIGKFPAEKLDAGLRERTKKRTWELFRTDPDAGVHSASEWLLRCWGANDEIRGALAELNRTPPAGARWFVNGRGQTFSAIQGPVDFIMGAPAYMNANLLPEQANRHHHHIPRSFAIATKEVTNAEYRKFLAENPKPKSPQDAEFDTVSPDPDGPVCGVTWFDAVRYCHWLSAKEGIPEAEQSYPPVMLDEHKEPFLDLKVGYLARHGYRLPTEAEWEYAARAGTVTWRSYGWTDAVLGEYEWCHLQLGLEVGTAQPVGRLMPNPLGMFDMLGNVTQWSTTHTLNLSAERDGIVNDTEGPNLIGALTLLKISGGARNSVPDIIHSAEHVPVPASRRSHQIGFRVARTLP